MDLWIIRSRIFSIEFFQRHTQILPCKCHVNILSNAMTKWNWFLNINCKLVHIAFFLLWFPLTNIWYHLYSFWLLSLADKLQYQSKEKFSFRKGMHIIKFYLSQGDPLEAFQLQFCCCNKWKGWNQILQAWWHDCIRE